MTDRPLVEDCIVLDICRMKRDGQLVHGEWNTGSITWRNKFSVSYQHDGANSLMLTYPDGHQQRLLLYRMPMPLGGHRCMFMLGGNRFAFKLYMPKGGTEFRSRAAHGLDYRCRHLGTRRRLEQRVDRMMLKYGFGMEIYKPMGMWSRTWESKKLALEALKAQELAARGKRLRARDQRGTMSPGAH
jgi:hypothetical protein